jgi:hypothetical protein
MDDGWLGKIASALGAVRTPLSLAGLAIIVLFIVYNRVLGLGIFSTLTDSQSLRLLDSLVGYVFWLALVGLVLGIAGFVFGPAAAGGNKKAKKN